MEKVLFTVEGPVIIKSEKSNAIEWVLDFQDKGSKRAKGNYIEQIRRTAELCRSNRSNREIAIAAGHIKKGMW